ncbi:MAG: cation:dicarboxylase symporter family transporter [Lentisphaerota bacterium]
MAVISFYMKLSLSKRIYIATAMGLLVGIFFGDLCATLEPLNIMFIRVFQITIIPYMFFSILQSIGSLNNESAKLIGKRGGIVLLVLWGISILYALGLQLSLPDIQRAKFFRPEESAVKSSLDLFDLFIPTNPFHSFANGYIPAIVIFSVLVGIAIIHESKKAPLIEYSRIMALLMKRVNDYITKLLPLGVLVMSSYTFGTISLASFKGVLLYILASLIYLVFMSMVVLPGIAISMTNLKYSKFLTYAMPAALIAFTTGSVFLALPVIYESMNKFDEEQKESRLDSKCDKEQKHNLVSIIVPLAWVVPATYKFLVIFFIIFAHWYYDSASSYIRELLSYIGGIPCLFGSNSIIVPFLLDISGLPSQAYNVFMLTASFMVYFNNANGAIFIVVCTILCYASIMGELKVKWSKLIAILISGTIAFVALLYGLNLLMGELISGNDEAKEELAHMNLHPYDRAFYAVIGSSYLTMDQYKEIPSLYDGEPLLDKIARTKILRAGYNPEAPPFSFFNQQRELVGFDIDTVYDLAKELDCNKIEFYEINNTDEYQQYLEKGQILDICLGGHLYNGLVMGDMKTSDVYMKLHPAILVPVADKDKYSDFNSVMADKNITVGILAGDGKGSGRGANNMVAGREMKPLSRFSDYFKLHKTYALLTSAEIASAINILYPGYWMFLFKGASLNLYFAYIMPAAPNAFTFRELVNSLIRISFRSGENDERYKYWIMGQAQIQTMPRWSVLGWLKKNK